MGARHPAGRRFGGELPFGCPSVVLRRNRSRRCHVEAGDRRQLLLVPGNGLRSLLCEPAREIRVRRDSCRGPVVSGEIPHRASPTPALGRAGRIVRPSLRPRSAMLRSMLTRGFCLALVLATGAASACSSSSPAPTSPAATPADSDPDAATGREVQISGAVSRIGGSCPAVRFLLGRVTVQTDRATTFGGGGCAQPCARRQRRRERVTPIRREPGSERGHHSGHPDPLAPSGIIFPVRSDRRAQKRYSDGARAGRAPSAGRDAPTCRR